MKEGINVLSLFDGMSCGMIALERAGIKVNKYYASEIKPHAIKVSQVNYPDIIQVGDITKISFKDGILNTENGEFNVGKIGLIIGGSPCQDFSQANKNITGLEGQKSRLFYEWLRLCHEICPDYFLLENVKMKKEYEDVITGHLGVKPNLIDSALVGPASRLRNYWTNIPNVTQPENKGIYLSDILENGYTDRKKARTLLESDSRPGTTPVKMFHRYFKFNTLIFKDKQHYSDCLEHYVNNYRGLDAKSIVCDSDIYNGVRFLNKRERERCQTVPEGYCDILSENDAACLLGDGWTVDVIAHIFKGLNK